MNDTAKTEEGNVYIPISHASARTVMCKTDESIGRLNPCLDIRNHSPTGFSWGYSGSGPAQLALAIMVNEYGMDLDRHPVHYMLLKQHVIAGLPQNKTWRLTSKDIREAIEKIREQS